MVLGRAAGAAGKGSLPQRSQRLFRIHLPAAVRGSARDTQLFWQDTSLSIPVGFQRGRVVDDGSILERDDGVRQDTGSVAVCAAGLRHRYVCFRHVRSRAAQPRSAGDDAVRVLAAAARAALDGGKHVCAGHRDQGFSGSGIALSGLAAEMGRRRKHGRFLRRIPVRRSRADTRLPAQCLRTEDLVSGHDRVEFGEGVWPARRAELVLGQPVDHRGDAPPDPSGQLQPG